MKRTMNKFSILTITLLTGSLIFGIGAMTACTSSKRGGNSTETASTGTGQHIETPNAENKQEVVKETPKETEKPTPEKSVEPDVLGKYECCEIGVEGRYTLTLKSNNAAVYKQVNEDNNSDGTGSWNWDKNKEFININLTVESSFLDHETLVEKTATDKVTFKLKKVGKDLQIVEENLSPKGNDGYFIGKTFKKS